MRFYDLIFLAFSTLVRYPLRTLMLLIATSIGVMAVILLQQSERALGTISLVNLETWVPIY